MSNSVWTVEALPQGDEIRKDGKFADLSDVERILNSHEVLVDALNEAIKDLVASRNNAHSAAKTDDRWEGVASILDERIDACREAVAQSQSSAC